MKAPVPTCLFYYQTAVQDLQRYCVLYCSAWLLKLHDHNMDTVVAAENERADAKPVEEDENADDDVDATDGAVEKALIETAAKPSKVALGAKQKSSKLRKVTYIATSC